LRQAYDYWQNQPDCYLTFFFSLFNATKSWHRKEKTKGTCAPFFWRDLWQSLRLFFPTERKKAKLPQPTFLLSKASVWKVPSLDRLSNRFKPYERHNCWYRGLTWLDFVHPAALTLTSQHILSGLPTLTQPSFLSVMLPWCAVWVTSVCVQTMKSELPKLSGLTQLVLLIFKLSELLLIEYQYKLSILGMGQSHSLLKPCPFHIFSDTQRNAFDGPDPR